MASTLPLLPPPPRAAPRNRFGRRAAPSSRPPLAASQPAAAPRGAAPASHRASLAPLHAAPPRGVPLLHALPSSATTAPATPTSSDNSSSAATWPLRAAGRHPESAAKLARLFRANDGLVYLRDFFEAAAFEALQAECAALRPRLRRERSATAENRLGLYLPGNGVTASAFRAPPVAARLSAIAGAPCFLSEYPLEYRMYPVGAHMAWHRDEALFAVPQLELVLTLRNSSDSATEWVDGAGQLARCWTEANSVLVVRAGGALHRVTPVRRGERDIVKVVFAFGSERTAAYDENLARTYL